MAGARVKYLCEEHAPPPGVEVTQRLTWFIEGLEYHLGRGHVQKALMYAGIAAHLPNETPQKLAKRLLEKAK